MYNFDRTITDLQQVNEDINEKYKRKCVELDKLEGENKMFIPMMTISAHLSLQY
jgi:hypothetical protein